MTFSDFQKTRIFCTELDLHCAQDGPGYLYAYGANIRKVILGSVCFVVDLDITEHIFSDLTNAEQYLFDNFVVPECIALDDTLSVEGN